MPQRNYVRSHLWQVRESCEVLARMSSKAKQSQSVSPGKFRRRVKVMTTAKEVHQFLAVDCEAKTVHLSACDRPAAAPLKTEPDRDRESVSVYANPSMVAPAGERLNIIAVKTGTPINDKDLNYFSSLQHNFVGTISDPMLQAIWISITRNYLQAEFQEQVLKFVRVLASFTSTRR